MFQKVLVANRGEIALRIIAACKELGVATVAVHSEADRDALHVRAADESVCIGPAAPSGSYLNITSLVAAAEITDADAVHPGYGFLAENAHFAEILEEVGLKWIGPSPDAIRRMGDKSVAKSTVKESGVPTIPGSPGPLDSIEDAMRLAGRIGYPVLLKAVAGGGGRGMRVARNDKELAAGFELATHEAERAFGNGSVYLEKYLAEPRHVEIQIFGDSAGTGRPPRRARVLAPAPPPEDPRGVAVSGALGRAAGEDGRRGGRRREGRELRRRRHGRVPPRRGRHVLLHGDEHADPGRASRDGDGHGLRPRQGADPRRARASRSRSVRRPATATEPAGGRAGTRSSSGSTRRIPSRSRRRPGTITTLPPARAAPASASTRRPTRAGRSRRTTTR